MAEVFYVDKVSQMERPYGTWPSPITTDLITKGTKKFEMVVLDGNDIYWNEMRPSEGGRSVIVLCDAEGKKEDITPPGFNVRTRVHEYGGGSFMLTMASSTSSMTRTKGSIYKQRDRLLNPLQLPDPDLQTY